MIFAGDVHQVINPTYFSEERIRKLYYMDCSGQRVTIEALKKNYRSQDKIVDLANDLSGIRKRRIGSRSQLSELSEVSVVEGWNPMQLASTEDNLRQLINTINELPYAAVIVQDENDQGYLASLVNGRESGNIYTIQEIKGLEKKYVVCYNIASLYSTIWKDIFSEKDIRKNAKYRYYFNTPTIRLWVTEYLATSQDLLPFIAKAVEWYGMDLTDSSLGQTQVVCVR
jgi:DNA helicase-2/ATP-dependent DNA helicase PcrA